MEEFRNPGGAPERLRIDKWLWAARFFKTRSLAAQAVDAGRVQLNGARVKPSREVRPGDAVRVLAGGLEWVVTVRRLADRRGPATAARALYEESEASRLAREAEAAARKAHPDPAFGMKGRPSKRDRRLLRRLTGE